MCQLIVSYVFFINTNQSQYSVLWDICILFPGFGIIKYFLLFALFLLKTALLSANQIQ